MVQQLLKHGAIALSPPLKSPKHPSVKKSRRRIVDPSALLVPASRLSAFSFKQIFTVLKNGVVF